MARSGLRRLAAEHAALHEELPPNYLLPSDDSADDLTQLTALLAGPQGTPYAQGLWRLYLKMPEDYPKSPPKATFKTRIWHPNVEESTGTVCVDTLKRDWKQTLTLKDVLITISCLLIYPNPNSALNSAAGSLLQENYDAFARQAKLMTSIHAPVPPALKHAVAEAKTRGEDAGTSIPDQEDVRSLRSRKNVKVQQSLTMKKSSRRDPATTATTQPSPHQRDHHATDNQRDYQQPPDDDIDSGPIFADDEPEDPSNASKENDPSLSPSPVKFAPPSPRKNGLGKRPLSVLTAPVDIGPYATEAEDTDGGPTTASVKNIAANYSSDTPERDGSPQRKSPKLSVLNKGVNSSGRIREEVKIFEDAPESMGPDHQLSGDGKENHESRCGTKELMGLGARKPQSNFPSTIFAPSSSSSAPHSSARPSKSVPGSRKVSGLTTMKAKPRIGIRRL
ncbi:putative ubiquitin conjugating enzyme E2 [Aspergillus tanneri]|uniref:UBC core domain-containing protein n=1 Tax=Aspergillus tanneri TaxID=1220188 RepID=A0A5M9N370_9EURO|nr:uncharacterized protein ATNIH1004_000904 [Aspergillus tanneri]KAA8652004.1 hypothetical protein ATNIH1004_000904 [Aspergillus tanneri]